jgi:hypothetical protein
MFRLDGRPESIGRQQRLNLGGNGTEAVNKSIGKKPEFHG